QARYECAGLRDQSENPTNKELIGPVWNPDLIPGNKTGRGADAVNPGTIGEMMFQIAPELVLRSSADTNDHMFRFALLEQREQRGIGDPVAAPCSRVSELALSLSSGRRVLTALPFGTAHRAVATSIVIGRDIALVD